MYEEDIEALNNLKRNISDAYSEGKLSSEYYINLKEELSTLFQEIFSKRIDSLNEAPNKEIKEEYLNAIKQVFLMHIQKARLMNYIINY